MIISQAKHANGEHSWGINGETGKIVDMNEYGLYESASVKVRPSPSFPFFREIIAKS